MDFGENLVPGVCFWIQRSLCVLKEPFNWRLQVNYPRNMKFATPSKVRNLADCFSLGFKLCF